jgi:hypothetical protein
MRVICTRLTPSWYNYTHMKFCVQNAEFRVNHLIEYIRIITRLNMYVSVSPHEQEDPFRKMGSQFVSPYSFNIPFSWTHVRFCENDGGWARYLFPYPANQVIAYWSINVFHVDGINFHVANYEFQKKFYTTNLTQFHSVTCRAVVMERSWDGRIYLGRFWATAR